MTLPWFPPGTPEHAWMAEQVDRIITGWETANDSARWTPAEDSTPQSDTAVAAAAPTPEGEPR